MLCCYKLCLQAYKQDINSCQNDTNILECHVLFTYIYIYDNMALFARQKLYFSLLKANTISRFFKCTSVSLKSRNSWLIGAVFL